MASSTASEKPKSVWHECLVLSLVYWVLLGYWQCADKYGLRLIGMDNNPSMINAYDLHEICDLDSTVGFAQYG